MCFLLSKLVVLKNPLPKLYIIFFTFQVLGISWNWESMSWDIFSQFSVFEIFKDARQALPLLAMWEMKCLKIFRLTRYLWNLQGLWFDVDSALWMLPCMNDDLANSLKKSGYLTLQQLLNLPKTALQNLIGNFPASKLTQVRNVLRDISTWFYIQGIKGSSTCQQLHIHEFDINIRDEFDIFTIL